MIPCIVTDGKRRTGFSLVSRYIKIFSFFLNIKWVIALQHFLSIVNPSGGRSHGKSDFVIAQTIKIFFSCPYRILNLNHPSLGFIFFFKGNGLKFLMFILFYFFQLPTDDLGIEHKSRTRAGHRETILTGHHHLLKLCNDTYWTIQGTVYGVSINYNK